MKNTIILIFALSVIISCNKKPIVVDNPTIPNTEINKTSSNLCYRGVLSKDTVAMALNIVGDEVSGKLTYNYFEKDKNTGTIKGLMKGDTLIADYSFLSEGMASVRQIIFLKKGNKLTEGYGEVIDDNNGKVIFKDLKKIKFEGKNVLSEVKCD